jgi:hypothetical protein
MSQFFFLLLFSHCSQALAPRLRTKSFWPTDIWPTHTHNIKIIVDCVYQTMLQRSVGFMPVGFMPVGFMPVGLMPVGKMPVGKLLTGQMLVNACWSNAFWSNAFRSNAFR